MTTQQAIEQSIRTNLIVRLPFSTDAETDLLCASEDSAETETEVEFWGVDCEGDDWRVHLVK